MKEYMSIGAVVMAIAGREKGEIFLIQNVQGEYAYLVNGKTRTLEVPKKKNLKHLQLLCKSEKTNLDMLNISNAQIYKFLNDYNKSRAK